MAQTQQLTLANVSAPKWTALVFGRRVVIQLGCGQAPPSVPCGSTNDRGR